MTASSYLFKSINVTALLLRRVGLFGLNLIAFSNSFIASSGLFKFNNETALLLSDFSESDFNLNAASNVITASLDKPLSNYATPLLNYPSKKFGFNYTALEKHSNASSYFKSYFNKQPFKKKLSKSLFSN